MSERIGKVRAKEIEEKARALLMATSAIYTENKEFVLITDSWITVVLDSGERVQFHIEYRFIDDNDGNMIDHTTWSNDD